MLPKINPEHTQSWQNLEMHFAQNDFDLRSLFKENPNRFAEFSVKRDGYLFDFSKNLIDQETLNLLLQLAEETQLKSAISAMFEGQKINETEDRAVLHTALRDFSDDEILVDGENIKPGIKRVLDQMKTFSTKVISGEHKGFSGKEITEFFAGRQRNIY